MTRAWSFVKKPSHSDMNSVFMLVTVSCSDDLRWPRKLSTSSANNNPSPSASVDHRAP